MNSIGTWRSPLAEHGFGRVPNLIEEARAAADLSGKAHRILAVLCRETYGLSRDRAKLKVDFLQERTGLSRGAVSQGLNELLEHRVVIRHGEAIKGRPPGNQLPEYSLNEDITGWNTAILKGQLPTLERFTPVNLNVNLSSDSVNLSFPSVNLLPPIREPFRSAIPNEQSDSARLRNLEETYKKPQDEERFSLVNLLAWHPAELIREDAQQLMAELAPYPKERLEQILRYPTRPDWILQQLEESIGIAKAHCNSQRARGAYALTTTEGKLQECPPNEFWGRTIGEIADHLEAKGAVVEMDGKGRVCPPNYSLGYSSALWDWLSDAPRIEPSILWMLGQAISTKPAFAMECRMRRLGALVERWGFSLALDEHDEVIMRPLPGRPSHMQRTEPSEQEIRALAMVREREPNVYAELVRRFREGGWL